MPKVKGSKSHIKPECEKLHINFIKFHRKIKTYDYQLVVHETHWLVLILQSLQQIHMTHTNVRYHEQRLEPKQTELCYSKWWGCKWFDKYKLELVTQLSYNPNLIAWGHHLHLIFLTMLDNFICRGSILFHIQLRLR